MNTDKTTIENESLKLTWDESTYQYKVNKPGDQSGEYVRKANYERIKEDKANLLEALKDAHALLLTNNDIGWWIKHKEEVAQIYEAIQKASPIFRFTYKI